MRGYDTSHLPKLPDGHSWKIRSDKYQDDIAPSVFIEVLRGRASVAFEVINLEYVSGGSDMTLAAAINKHVEEKAGLAASHAWQAHRDFAEAKAEADARREALEVIGL